MMSFIIGILATIVGVLLAEPFLIKMRYFYQEKEAEERFKKMKNGYRCLYCDKGLLVKRGKGKESQWVCDRCWHPLFPGQKDPTE